MSIDKIVKEWKAQVKESQTVLERLEDEARKVAEMQGYAHDARSLIEDAVRGLETVQSDKASTETEMLTAMLTDDAETLEGLRERHASLTEREQALQGEIQRLTGVVEANTVDAGEVASLKAALHRFGASGGDELVQTVKALIKEHSDSLRARSEAAQELLPDVDSLTLLGALGEHTEAYRALYAGHKDTIEHEERISPAAGEKARERLDYAVERILTRA